MATPIDCKYEVARPVAFLAAFLLPHSTQLVKYLSHCKRRGEDCVLKAVLLVSVLWDMFHARENLRKFVNRHILVRYLAFSYIRMMKE